MKKGIHPDYQEVVFVDTGTGKKFLCFSTLKSDETVDFEGKKYPCIKVSISSDSHPFFTGDQKFVDTEGRVDRFMKKYESKPLVKPESQTAKKEGSPKKGVTQKVVAKKAVAKKADVKKKSAPKKNNP